jgi:hypothetical protein
MAAHHLHRVFVDICVCVPPVGWLYRLQPTSCWPLWCWRCASFPMFSHHVHDAVLILGICVYVMSTQVAANQLLLAPVVLTVVSSS